MRSLALGLCLISLPVFACPNLAGKYPQCRSVNGEAEDSYDLEIGQSIHRGITTYVSSWTELYTNERKSETYRADGQVNVQTVKDPETGMVVSLSNKVYCKGKALKTEMVLRLDGQVISNITTTTTRTGNQLQQVVTGDNFGEEINETVICE